MKQGQRALPHALAGMLNMHILDCGLLQVYSALNETDQAGIGQEGLKDHNLSGTSACMPGHCCTPQPICAGNFARNKGAYHVRFRLHTWSILSMGRAVSSQLCAGDRMACREDGKFEEEPSYKRPCTFETMIQPA